MKAKSIIEELRAHHNEMRKLQKEIEDDRSKYIILKKHLDVHHELEEDILLSELHKNDAVKNESLESKEEHFVLNFLLMDLADFPQDNFRWPIKFQVFSEILNHHLEEEEEDLFPEAEKHLSKNKLEEFGARFFELKEKRLKYELQIK